MLKDLFDLAASNLQKQASKGKGFELYVLWRTLRRMQSNGFSVTPMNVKNGVLIFAGSPAAADKHKFSYFALTKSGERNQEAWISVEVFGLSSDISSSAKGSHFPASRHEIDVATFYELTSTQPSSDDLTFAATCKHTAFQKAYLREALGLRRETAYFDGLSHNSRADWFIDIVPAQPPVPVALFSSDPKCIRYQIPVDSWGVYVRKLSLPILL
jgi:hypothetical protein